jgi:hypothetical protein
MNKRLAYIVLIFTILTFIFFSFWKGYSFFDSEEEKKTFDTLFFVIEDGFKDDSIKVIVNNQLVFNNKVTSDPSNSMASDFFPVYINQHKTNTIFLKSQCFKLKRTLNLHYRNIIIRKNFCGLRIIYTNNILAYD